METIGRYQLIEEVGRGGMGIVYRAQDAALNREVALKLLPTYWSRDATFLQRFQREAQIVARLEHAHIVPVYDVGEHQGQPFLVMRLLRGGSLRDRLQTGAMNLTELWPTLHQVALALDAAHARHVVHRDVKPTNILFDEQDTAFISDFGIAQVANTGTQLTGSNLIGSPAYMSPEQFKGQGVDGRSDQYNLAVVIYEALAGALPFSGDTVQMMYQHLEAPVPPVHNRNSDLPPALSTVLGRALAKQPEARYESVSAFAQALQAVTTSQVKRLPPAASEGKTDSTHVRQVQSAYARGLAAWEQGDWAAVVSAFARVLELEPDHPKAQERHREAQQRLKAKLGTPSPAKPAAKERVVSEAGGLAAQSAHFRPGRWLPVVVVLLLLAGVAGVLLARPAVGALNRTATRRFEAAVATVDMATATKDAVEVVPTDGVTRKPGGESPVEPQRSIITATAVLETLQGDGGSHVLGDGVQLFLNGEATTVDVVAVAGQAGAAETSLVLRGGALVVQAAGKPVVVANPFGAKVTTDNGLMGITYVEQPFRFEVVCLAGNCRLVGDLEGELMLSQGEAGFVGGSGRPGELETADYSVYAAFASVVPTPTATPTPTPTVTRTPTPLPTQTRPPATATATATATAPATATPLPPPTTGPPAPTNSVPTAPPPTEAPTAYPPPPRGG